MGFPCAQGFKFSTCHQHSRLVPASPLLDLPFSLLFSATAWCISIEGSSSQGRIRQPLPKLRVGFGSGLHGPCQAPCGWLISNPQAGWYSGSSEVAPSAETQQSNPFGPWGWLVGVELVKSLHSIHFMVSELGRTQEATSFLSPGEGGKETERSEEEAEKQLLHTPIWV